MLKHADDDAWRDTLALREIEHRSFTARSRRDKLSPRAHRNERVARPGIGLFFLIGAVARLIIDENALLAVQEDMGGFVKEAEPQVIV